MKKIILLLICILAALPAFADSAVLPVDINFSPAGNGTFIYCNNRESVQRHLLSDNSNPNPTYLMNNEDLGAGKYSLYVSLLNHTELLNENGGIAKPGFDMEADAYIKANQDTVITFTAMGFEVPALIETYANGALERNEGDWSCIQAVADYMGRELRSVRGEFSFMPRPFNSVTVELKNGQVMWISELIDNYCVVNWLKPVHLLSDFEITQGNIDLNIAILKSNGKVGDRSHHVEDAAFGKYVRDRQYKGIADSLPYMYSDEMKFVIDDGVRDGTELPVTVYNHYSPDGRTITKWFTHINPLEDIWSRAICTQSDILPIYYKDSSKLDYYGALVPKSKKSDVWYFDVNHSDLASYNGNSRTEKANFHPNALLSSDVENTGSACNLGNYGVFVNYKVSVENKGNNTRYFNYNLKTTANNIVSLRDENGQYVNDFSYAKGQTDQKRDDIMAYVELPAGKTTTFYIEILLPMNNPGGMENSFVITDNPPTLIVSDEVINTTLKSDNFTGREYYKWGQDCLYTSKDGVDYVKQNLTSKTKEAFKDNFNAYKITAAGDGYIARFAPFQANPSYYQGMLKYYKNLYILDKSFNVVNIHAFESFVSDATYANGVYYVKADKIYYSYDGRNWEQSKTLKTIPVSTENGYAYAVSDGQYFVSFEADNFIPVSYGKEKPEFLEAFGDYYCYSVGNTLYVSKDGLYFESAEYPETIKTVEFVNGELAVNKVYGFDVTNITQKPLVVINDKLVKLDNIPDGTKLPLRQVMEELNARVLWDETNQAINVIYNKDSFMIMSDGKVSINNAPTNIVCDMVQISGTTFISGVDFKDVFSVDVAYNDKYISVDGAKDKVLENEEYAEFDTVEITKEQAGLIAEALGFLETEIFYNEESGYFEISRDGKIILVIRKADGKILKL